MNIKKHFIKISLSFTLVLAVISCISTLISYKGNTYFMQTDNLFRINYYTNFTVQIISYAIIFFAVCIIAYYTIDINKIKINTLDEKFIIISLLAIGLLTRISISILVNSYSYDIKFFIDWIDKIANSLTHVYQGDDIIDYPPLYIYVLYLIGKITNIPLIHTYYILVLKLPSIMADTVTSLLIYKLSKKYLSIEMSIILASFYMFNPAIIINSSIWGQVDSLFTMLVMLSFVLISEKRIVLASIMLTSAILMKPQGLIFVPVFFFELLRENNLLNWVKASISMIVTSVIIIIPFSPNLVPIWMIQLFKKTLNEYPFASVNAFNFFSLIGANFISDSISCLIVSYHSLGLLFIIVITTFSWFLFIKGDKRIFTSAIALMILDGVFVFSTRMHERYIYPTVALSILTYIYIKDKRLILLSIGLSLTTYINTHYVLFESFQGIDRLNYSPILVITSTLNILLFAYLIRVLYNIINTEKKN